MSILVHIPEDSDFPLDNLPYGVGIPQGLKQPRPLVAIGDLVLCLATLADAALLDGSSEDPRRDFTQPSLNTFMAQGPQAWSALRQRITELLTDSKHWSAVSRALSPRLSANLLLPWTVGDYVDFYSSRAHAENVGRIFRPNDEPLLPNWLHMPIGYHGRAGSVVVSGTEIARPQGQRKVNDFGPSDKLDIEAEIGFVIGVGSKGPIATKDIADHVFGLVLVNDWSARDIPSWETRPLGPFLGKSFATSVSPWIVPLAALESRRVPPHRRDDDPALLDYLKPTADWGFDLDLSIEINGQVISRPPFKTMQWTMDQQLAHATINGAATRTGDLFASGTISGADQPGSLLELTLDETYLNDGDIVRISAPRFGAVTGKIRAAR